ncbi:hypothetical protein [Clostridium saccharoperbutylacetonicum]
MKNSLLGIIRRLIENLLLKELNAQKEQGGIYYEGYARNYYKKAIGGQLYTRFKN